MTADQIKVAIADERIQKQATITFDGGINSCNKKHADFLDKCGIYTPSEETDLNSESFDTEINKEGVKQTIKEQ